MKRLLIDKNDIGNADVMIAYVGHKTKIIEPFLLFQPLHWHDGEHNLKETSTTGCYQIYTVGLLKNALMNPQYTKHCKPTFLSFFFLVLLNSYKKNKSIIVVFYAITGSQCYCTDGINKKTLSFSDSFY